MSTTPESAVQTVVTALNAATITRGDGAALTIIDFDPLPGGLDWPACAAVTFGGMSDTFFTVLVRLYVDGGSDIPAAEKLCRSLTPAVDTALDTVRTPRTDWSKSWSPDFVAYIVETALAIGRDDF